MTRTRGPQGVARERVFSYVRRRLRIGEPPTIREVQQAMGFSAVQTARDHLERLVDEGRLVKVAGKSRAYRLPDGSSSTQGMSIPILGRVQAGALSTAVQDIEDYITIDPHYSSAEIFALRVRGDSMVDAGILPDDIVVVRCQETANNGDIVVALVEDEATVKRFVRRDGRIELHPENPAFQPIIPDPEALRLLGKVIEVRRQLR